MKHAIVFYIKRRSCSIIHPGLNFLPKVYIKQPDLSLDIWKKSLLKDQYYFFFQILEA